ncbi:MULTISPECIES: alpha/beta hydrolase [Paenibacillus]|uniref:alpha/beta hydrolase n=1 Tax=Paenibacillus TaxID=44249 RepID=UPI0019150D29|nr:hypothetical protein [Paenibacillus sp. EPM92]
MNIHLQQPVVTRGVPLDKSSAVVMMMHGRNQTTNDILELADRISLPDVHYVAPQAAGNSWYPNGFMSPLNDNEPYLSFALDCYHTRISELLEQGIPVTKLVLLGFSQGACLTAEYAVRRPGRYGGIVLYTGGVIGPEGMQRNVEGSFLDTPVFLGSSDIDGWVPEQRVLETAALYKQMGADTEARIYKDMDHIVNDDEIAFARALIRQVQSA